MLLKYLLAIVVLMTSSLLFAQLPKEVVASCHEEKAINSSVSYMEPPGSYDYQKIEGSEERYQFDVNRHHFSLEDHQYFVRGSSWIKLSDAINHSNHPIAKPGNINNPMTVGEIIFNKKHYLCISGSLFINGSLSAVGEYYIVENALDYDKKIHLYYYFFDKEFVEIVRSRDG